MLVPTVDNHWVSEEYAQIAEIINDYDEHLRLVWIPPENRIKGDSTPPYAVVETNGEGKESIVMTIRENELDHRILARLFRGDTHKNNVIAMLEADETAAKALDLKKKMEKAEERKNLIESIVSSPLHTFKHNGRVFPK